MAEQTDPEIVRLKVLDRVCVVGGIIGVSLMVFAPHIFEAPERITQGRYGGLFLLVGAIVAGWFFGSLKPKPSPEKGDKH